MIHRIHSSLKTFKTLEFKTGLNVLIAKKEAGATEKQTRNGAGKSSLIEIVHFLMGSDAGKESLFRSEELINANFGMTFDLGGEIIRIERSGHQNSKVLVQDASYLGRKTNLSNTEWIGLLGDKMFRLHEIPEDDGHKPTFRSLFAYFVRRQLSGAFTTPEKQAIMQKAGDYQVALMFLLGLDWKVASDWQKVRDREKTLKELKKAAGTGAFGSIVGKASDLRTELTVAEARLTELKSQVTSFRVLPQYAKMEAEADQLTRDINDLSNANVIDVATVEDLELSIQSELPPSLADLQHIYEEAGVVLPGVAIKRYEDVRSFHESVVRNRRDYLAGELDTAKQRIALREQEKQRLDARRAVVMGILKSHGALNQFSQLQ